MALAAVADPVAGLVGYLTAQDDLNEFCNGRIFGGRLPAKTADALQQDPAPALVISTGPLSFTDPYTIKIIYTRIEFRMFAQKSIEIMQLWWELYRLLNGQQALVTPNALFKSIMMNSAPNTFPDPDIHMESGVGFATVISQREPV